MIHRKVENSPLLIVAPVLRAVSGENRMLHRKDQNPAGLSQRRTFIQKIVKGFQIMEHQGAENDIEGIGREAGILKRFPPVIDAGDAG